MPAGVFAIAAGDERHAAAVGAPWCRLAGGWEVIVFVWEMGRLTQMKKTRLGLKYM